MKYFIQISTQTLLFFLFPVFTFSQTTQLEWVINPGKYDIIGSFSDGIAIVAKKRKVYPYGYKFAIIDRTGTIIVSTKYDNISKSSKGFLKVKKYDKYGFIDRKGKIIVPVEYDGIGDFSEGMVKVQKEGKWGFVNKKGKVVVPIKYNQVGVFSEGLVRVRKRKKWGFIDKRGKTVIPFQYDYAWSFRHGLAGVKKWGGDWGIINSKGDSVTSFIFENVYLFYNGISRAKYNNQWGFINSIGDSITSFVFKEAYPFSNSFAKVQRDNYWGIIDTNGKSIIPLRYENISAFSEGFFGVESEGKWGFMNTKGEVKVPFVYDYVYPFSEGIAEVEKDGKYGYVDKNGKIIISLEFDETYSFSEGLAVVKKDGKWGVIKKPLFFQQRSVLSPKIQLISPKNINANQIYKTNQQEIILKGKVLHTKANQVSINGKTIMLDKNQVFEVNLQANYQSQTYTIEAIGDYSQKTTFSFMVKKKRFEVPGVVDKTPPQIKITAPTLTTREVKKKRFFHTQQNVVDIAGQVIDASGIRIFTINGKPYSLSEGKFYSQMKLKDGKNEVILLAIDKSGNKRAEKFTIVKIKNTPRQTSQTNLYMVSIGISPYQKLSKKDQLTYADDDARAMEAIFNSSQNKPLFNQIHTQVLLNEQATRTNIINSFSWLKKNATAKDLIVIFIACHGIKDGEDLYILPYDGDPENLLATGVDWNYLGKTIARVKCRKILFVDACHSAQMGKNIQSRGVFDVDKAHRDLNRQEQGTILFSAAASQESSLESKNWQHGAFTKALIEGLKNENGKADYNNDGLIYLSELNLYVLERVKALTSGNQHPSLQKPASITQLPLVIWR